jgi:hypothetical protein
VFATRRKVTRQELLAEAGGIRMVVYGTIWTIVLAQGMMSIHGVSGSLAVLYALLITSGVAGLIVGMTYFNLRRR